jgi:hypothetical protein
VDIRNLPGHGVQEPVLRLLACRAPD